jgi:hypothetical protein
VCSLIHLAIVLVRLWIDIGIVRVRLGRSICSNPPGITSTA